MKEMLAATTAPHDTAGLHCRDLAGL